MLRFLFVSTQVHCPHLFQLTQTPFLKALETSNSSSGSLILIWIQLIKCSFKPALAQFPSLPLTLVKTFENFPRNQISASLNSHIILSIAPPKQTNHNLLWQCMAGQEVEELLLVVLSSLVEVAVQVP